MVGHDRDAHWWDCDCERFCDQWQKGRERNAYIRFALSSGAPPLGLASTAVPCADLSPLDPVRGVGNGATGEAE